VAPGCGYPAKGVTQNAGRKRKDAKMQFNADAELGR
jgi:hypothetical protein